MNDDDDDDDDDGGDDDYDWCLLFSNVVVKFQLSSLF